MADELKAEFSADVELIPGSRGIFDVKLEDKLLFSKHAEDNRFPADGEVARLIRECQVG